MKNPKTIYYTLAVIFSLCGTAALYCARPVLWLALCLAANIFCVSATVCGTEIKTITRKKLPPRHRSDEFFGKEKQETPKETGGIEQTVLHVPAWPFFLAFLLATVTGFATHSAWLGLLVLFTWGGLGYPLARCILQRFDFGLSMQSGLISAGLYTALAGVIQILVSTPDHSFQLKQSIVWVSERAKEALTGSLIQAKDFLATQSFEGLTPEYKGYIDQISQTLENPALLSAQTVDQFLSIVPGLFAVAVLALLCIIWWGCKAALRKNTEFEVKYMGRLDHYIPGRILTGVYVLFLILQMTATQGSALQIASSNIVFVSSAALALSGFSLILFIINSRVRSTPLRALLIAGIIIFVLPTCGVSVLYLLGIMSTWVDLRNLLGGGTLK